MTDLTLRTGSLLGARNGYIFGEEESVAKNKVLSLLSLLLGAAQVGCQDDCLDEKDAMQSFLVEPAHLTCESNEDCTVVTVGCIPVDVHGALCGQVPLNKSAAASSEWKSLRSAADDCAGQNCGMCDAALTAWCKEGFCGGPP